MNEFNIGSYESLKEAATLTNNCSKELINDIERANLEIEKLKTDIFDGPISNNVREEWTKIKTTSKNNAITLSGGATFLIAASSNYQSSDNTNSSNIARV